MESEAVRIEQGARLQRLIKALKTNQTGFAGQMGVSQSNINKMVRGAKGISRTVINGLLLVHKNVNVHWLLTGEGNMFFDEATGRVEEPAVPYEKRRAGLLLGEVEAMLEEHAREIEGLKATVAQLEAEVERLRKQADELR
jgi:transcriptional regulator with XRE-family HTH domain